jgi:hypothetical protein
MTPNEDLLRNAILAKLPISAVHSGKVRQMCPHVLGHKNGKLHLLAYQYAGESNSGTIITPADPTNGPANY